MSALHDECTSPEDFEVIDEEEVESAMEMQEEALANMPNAPHPQPAVQW